MRSGQASHHINWKGEHANRHRQFPRAKETDSLLKCLCSQSVFHQWQELFVPWSLSSSTRVYHTSSILSSLQTFPSLILPFNCGYCTQRKCCSTTLCLSTENGMPWIVWKECMHMPGSKWTDNELFFLPLAATDSIKGSFNPEMVHFNQDHDL